MTMPRSGPRRGLARAVLHDTWDDTRRVAIIPEAPAHRGAAGACSTRSRAHWDAEGYGPTGWQNYAPRYGAERLQAGGRARTRGAALMRLRQRVDRTDAVGQPNSSAFAPSCLNGGSEGAPQRPFHKIQPGPPRMRLPSGVVERNARPCPGLYHLSSAVTCFSPPPRSPNRGRITAGRGGRVERILTSTSHSGREVKGVSPSQLISRRGTVRGAQCLFSARPRPGARRGEPDDVKRGRASPPNLPRPRAPLADGVGG